MDEELTASKRERLRALRSGGYGAVGYYVAIDALVDEYELTLRSEHPAEVLRLYRERIDSGVSRLVHCGCIYQISGDAEGVAE